MATDRQQQHVLVLGAYGLIGRGVVRRLLLDGHQVTGFGRDAAVAQRVFPDLSWVIDDLRALTTAEAWGRYLAGVTSVVNCSGALQDGPADDLEVVHHHAIAALAAACADAGVRVVQVSAVGALSGSEIAFLSSKARGDAAVRTSGAAYQILRPGLVLAPQGYGGTALLRMLAAVPVVQPIALPNAKIQTVGLDDVAAVVAACVTQRVTNGSEMDLVETETHSLRDLVAAMRAWLGFRPAKVMLVMPAFAARLVGHIADGLGRLGWRSPLRSTAQLVLAQGVTGTPPDVAQYSVGPISDLRQTLAQMPARPEDRLAARIALLAPVILATLCVFWIVSGLVGIARLRAAADVLVQVGWPLGLAVASVLFWSVVDILIGVGFAVRKYVPLACWASVGVSLTYLAASTIFVPHLWADPLGPLVKVVPAIVLSLVARAAIETR